MTSNKITGYVLLSIFVLASAVMPQNRALTVESVDAPTDLSWNDQLVLNSMRVIHSAEMTHRNNFGNGNYGSLQSLQQGDLIDSVLATGQKHGYRFTVSVRFATATMQPGYELTATPVVRRARYLSFYMNEACDIRGADRAGRDASLNDPIVQPCGVSIRTENESYATGSLRNIHTAQMTYLATNGAGQFGSPAQLYDANLLSTGFVLSYIWKGYAATFTNTPLTATEPPKFTISIVPSVYRRTGLRSYFIDETGVLRGGDKNGGPANQNDPPIPE